MDKGNDHTRESLVVALRESADGLVVGHPILTRFVETLAKDLGKAGMLEKAEDIARGMKLAGIETWGDMRVVDKQTLVENGGMCVKIRWLERGVTEATDVGREVQAKWGVEH